MSASRTGTPGLQAMDRQNIVDRIHREGGPFQWGPEVTVRSLKADAGTSQAALLTSVRGHVGWTAKAAAVAG